MALPRIELVRPAAPISDFQKCKLQDEVIAFKGSPLAVFGAAGTGKTQTLIRKVVSLISDGVDPNSILVLTYGRIPAGELRDNIVLQSNATAFEPLVRTFHSLAFSIINHELTGSIKKVLLSGGEQDSFIRALLETEFSKSLWPTNLAKAVPTRGFAREVRDLILRAQERGLTPETLAQLGKELSEPLWESAAKFWLSYQQILALQTGTPFEVIDRVDNSQIIGDAISILKKNKDLLSSLRSQFKYILVDEFHESEKSQRELLDLISSQNLTLFIDTDSAIGVFRGADPEGVYPYIDGKKFTQITLEENFRVDGGIAKLDKEITDHLRVKSPARSKNISKANLGSKIEVVKLTSSADSANYIAHAFRTAHLKSGVPWSEMAVIVRSPGASVSSLIRAMSLNNIPVEVESAALALNENPAVRPLITLAKIVIGSLKLTPSAWPEIEDLLRSEYGGADSLSLRNMRLALSKLRSEEDPRNSIELTLGILDGEVSPLDDELIIPLKRISQLIKEGRKAKRAGGNISDIFWALWSNAKNYGGESLQKVWRESALRGGARGGLADRDLDAVIQLFEVARRFTDRLPDSKPELFIDQITNESILSDAITAKGIRDEVVSILTVHSAKGKEWEMVALSGLQEGVWPNLKQRGSLLGSERLVEHLRTGLKARDAIESSSRSALIEDERRLLHVAVSRAKSKLIVVAHNEEDSESSNYFDEMYEFVHGENSFDAPALSAPRAITQQAVVAELRDLVEGGDETAAKALNLLAKSGVTSANPDNWIGSKVISSEERAVSLDAEVSVSPSNLQVFSECGLKWFIERSGGKDGDSTAQLVGNAIHGIAQKFKETPDIKLPEIQELLSSNWKLIDQNKGWIKEYELAEALEKVEKLFYWQADASQLRKLVAVEAKFGTRIEKIYFNGSADRVEIDQDGKYFIVDLKSGSGSDVTYGAAKENKQLAAYQLAFLEGAFEDENLRGDVSGSSLVFLGNDAKKAAEKPQERIDQELIKADLISSAKSMTANEFVATQNKRCRTCAIKKICPIQPNGRTVLDGN